MHLGSSSRALLRLSVLALAVVSCAKSEEGIVAAASKRSASTGAEWAWKKAPFIDGRAGHSMATLGNKIVVFGGRASSFMSAKTHDDTWEWDGARWTRRYLQVRPSGRYSACAAVLGGKLVLFGGFVEKTQAPSDETWEYDGRSWTKRNPTNRPLARSGHACSAVGSKILLHGGWGGQDVGLLSDTWEWDGAEWTEQAPAMAPPARRDSAMATLDGRVLLVGGQGGTSGTGLLGDVWEWDGTTWKSKDIPIPSSGGSLLELGGKLLHFGRRLGSSALTIREWDGSTWREVDSSASAPEVRAGSGIASLSGKVYVFGGVVGLTGGNAMWEWDGSTWSDRSDQPSPGWTGLGHTASASFGDKVVYYGEGDPRGLWEWDGRRWARRHLPAAIPVLGFPTLVEFNSKLLLFGTAWMGQQVNQAWEWDGNDWSRGVPFPADAVALMAPLAGRLVVYRPWAQQTWEWDGTSWIQRTPASSPPPRYQAAMATLGNRVVLFGSTNLSDHWEWDGTNWSERSLPIRPSAGANVLAALGDRLFLYGSVSSVEGTANPQAWVWDGLTWAQREERLPPARLKAPLAQDAHGLVMFGGLEKENPLAETWVYRPLAPQGSPCADALECATDFCVDGVCCDKPCEGQCEACSVAGVEGTCVPVVGAPLGNRPACAGDGSECAGFCDGQDPDACAVPGTDRLCRVASCGLGEMTLEARCDGSGACPAPETSPCGPYACSATTCATDCETSAQCTAGHYCSDGTCVPALALAATCSSDAECASGHCSDGVCCASACTETCLACDVAGSVGQCVAVDGAPHGSRPACEGGASCVSGSCPQVPVEEEPSEGCGCATAASPMALLGLLALPGLRWRRRGSWQRRA